MNAEDRLMTVFFCIGFAAGCLFAIGVLVTVGCK